MSLDWKKIYLVGTEWYLYEKGEETKRHPCYESVLTRVPEWDFGHVINTIKEKMSESDHCYLWGGTEGHPVTDPTTGLYTDVPVMVPVIFALVTSQPAPDSFGIPADGDTSLVSLDEFGCRWKVSEDGKFSFLESKHLENIKEIEGMTEDEHARFGFANLYIEPEKIEPDRDPDTRELDNVLTIAFSKGTCGIQIEYDLRTDTLEKAAKRTIREEELDPSLKDDIISSIKKPVEQAQQRLSEEKERRSKMPEEIKNAWRKSLRLKFYPQNPNLGIIQSPFINRFFMKANFQYPAPVEAATSSFFNAGPPQEITVASEDLPATSSTTPSKPGKKSAPRTPGKSAKKRPADTPEKSAEKAAKRAEAVLKAQETRKRNREAAAAAAADPSVEPSPKRALRDKKPVKYSE